MAIDRPLADNPTVVFEELMEEIKHAILNQPRSLQVAIGPSEYGNPCDRALIQKLAGIPEPDAGDKVPWRTTVGTWMHAGLEDVFRNSWLQKVCDKERFLIEQRVTAGTYNGKTLAGSCDLFDTATGIVWDWKSKSQTRLKEHKRHGPSATYRAQMHAYGRGMELLGHTVRYVGNIYLPRDGEFRDIFPYFEPYDPTVVERALERLATLDQLISTFGVDMALRMHPTMCDDTDCHYCTRPKVAASTTGELFRRAGIKQTS